MASKEALSRILVKWPQFANVLLASRTKGSALKVFGNYIRNHPILFRFLTNAANYIKSHPILFSLQILGGMTAIASLAVLPVLGAVGFAVTGPVAGSAAAAWQASSGLVQAGSLFAWCQSAAMGGAAVDGIVAAGVTGGTVAAGAGIAGLRERVLVAWRRSMV